MESTNKLSFFQRMGSKLGDAGKVVSQTVSVASSIVGDKVEQAANAAKEVVADKYDGLTEFANNKVKKMVGNLPFDEVLTAIDKYASESGTDTKELRNFIVELQKFSQNGSK